MDGRLLFPEGVGYFIVVLCNSTPATHRNTVPQMSLRTNRLPDRTLPLEGPHNSFQSKDIQGYHRSTQWRDRPTTASLKCSGYIPPGTCERPSTVEPGTSRAT